MIALIPRGVRNNNPGNIDRDGTIWEGLAAKQTDPRFCVFVDAQYGIRALVDTLLTYQRVHHLMTLREMVARWAPPAENNTGAYLADLCGRTKLAADQVIDMRNRATAEKVAAAFIAHENAGYAYPEDVLDAALKLAGVE